MNCELTQTTVHGYFDGELDAVRSAEFQRHIEHCAECQSQLEQISSLRTALRSADLYQHAPAELRAAVSRRLPQESVTQSRQLRPLRKWFFVPAIAGFAATVLVLSFFVLRSQQNRSDRINAELIDAHVRSLQPGHLFDVESTDQHTVKPWFDGKVDFVPPVTDFSSQGFPLIGGRLDILDGHNVAALVYSRRKHLINVFVWPVRENGSVPATAGSRQGYNWASWQSGDMWFCMVSDASPTDLHDLKLLMTR